MPGFELTSFIVPQGAALRPGAEARGSPWSEYAQSASLSGHLSVLRPPELRAIAPHTMHDHGQSPGQRDHGLSAPTPLGHPHGPGFQPRPPGGLSQHRLSGFEQQRPHHRIPTKRDPTDPIGVAGLASDRRQPQDRSDSLGIPEPSRSVDGRYKGQQHNRTHSRNSHQAPAHLIPACKVQEFAVQNREVLATCGGHPAAAQGSRPSPACLQRARGCAPRT